MRTPRFDAFVTRNFGRAIENRLTSRDTPFYAVGWILIFAGVGYELHVLTGINIHLWIARAVLALGAVAYFSFFLLSII